MLLSRLYIYWHVKRCLKRSWNGVQGVTDASIDNAIQEVHDHNADSLRMVMEDVQCDEYFRAARWCAEQKAFMWLVQSNVRGASPSTAELFQVFEHSFPAISRGGRFLEFVRIGESKYRLNRWGGIFRRRWSVHYEGLPKANALTDAELAERAGPRGPQRPPEAPRGCQWVPGLPDAPRGSQRPAGAPRGPESRPEASRGGLTLPAAPRRSQRLPEASRGAQRLPEAISGCQRLPAAVRWPCGVDGRPGCERRF